MLMFAMKTTTVTLTPVEGGEALTDYSDVINELTLTPSAGSSVMAISGASYAGRASWSANLGLFQDADATGLMRYLLEHEGEKLTLKAEFVDGADPLECVVNVTPSTIGGAASNDLATATVTLPVDGKPAFLKSEEIQD